MDTRLKSPPQATKWWSSLEKQWQAIFKAAIGINREPRAAELVTILSLTVLKCNLKGLTSLEGLQVCTGLQTLDRRGNQLTHLSTEAEILRYFPSPPAPLPEGEGRKKIPENFCFST